MLKRGSFGNLLPESKKGQGMSTNAIILIILGIVVLVVLILGFTVGFGKIAPFLSGNNVDNIVTACSASCATASTYDFCFAKRDLKSDDSELNSVTCNYLSKEQTKYGIEACAQISCGDVVFVQANSVEELQGFCENNSGKTVQSLIEDTLESVDC